MKHVCLFWPVGGARAADEGPCHAPAAQLGRPKSLDTDIDGEVWTLNTKFVDLLASHTFLVDKLDKTLRVELENVARAKAVLSDLQPSFTKTSTRNLSIQRIRTGRSLRFTKCHALWC